VGRGARRATHTQISCLSFTVALHIAVSEFLGNRNNSNVDAKKGHAVRELQPTDCGKVIKC